MDFLVEIIPEKGRKVVYAFVAAAGLFLGSLSVAGTQLIFGAPVSTVQEVYAFIVASTGLLAYSNVPARREEEIIAVEEVPNE